MQTDDLPLTEINTLKNEKVMDAFKAQNFAWIIMHSGAMIQVHTITIYSKEKTKKTLEGLLKKLKGPHDQYEEITNILRRIETEGLSAEEMKIKGVLESLE